MRYPMLRNVPSLFGQDLFGVGRETNRLFGRDLFEPFEDWQSRLWTPAVDVRETSDAYRLDFEVPGLRPEDIEVTVQNDMLFVRGEKHVDLQEGKEEGTHRIRERRYGRFERSFRLPEGIDSEKLTAECENGILTVWLPKSEKARARRIQVSSSGETARISSGENS